MLQQLQLNLKGVTPTLSPIFKSFTSDPLSDIYPTTSWPGQKGYYFTSPHFNLTVIRSDWHSEV